MTPSSDTWFKSPDDDPLYPKLPQQQEHPVIDRPDYEPEPMEHGYPVRELARYVNNHWLQQLFAVRTRCFCCQQEIGRAHV